MPFFFIFPSLFGVSASGGLLRVPASQLFAVLLVLVLTLLLIEDDVPLSS
jgi:hypothetical protein